MSIKDALFDEDGNFDRNDVLAWLGILGLAVVVYAEVRAKIKLDSDISEMLYLTLMSLILGRPALRMLLGSRTKSSAAKKESIVVKTSSTETENG